jgi:hypothetical protein
MAMARHATFTRAGRDLMLLPGLRPIMMAVGKDVCLNPTYVATVCRGCSYNIRAVLCARYESDTVSRRTSNLHHP